MLRGDLPYPPIATTLHSRCWKGPRGISSGGFLVTRCAIDHISEPHMCEIMIVLSRLL